MTIACCWVCSRNSPKQFIAGVLTSLLTNVRLFPCGGVRLYRCVPVRLRMFVFTCLPVCCLHLSPFVCLPSFVSRSGWRCPALWMSVFACLPSFVCQRGWWCPPLRLFMSLDVCLRLSPFMCLRVWLVVSSSPDVCLHLCPFFCGGVRLFGSLSSLVSFLLSPMRLVVSRPFRCLSSLVSTRLSPSLLSSLVSLHWFPPLAGESGGLRLFTIAFFSCRPSRPPGPRPPGHGHPPTRPRPHGHPATRP